MTLLRRTPVLIAVAAIAVHPHATSFASAQPKPKLFVYLHTALTASALEKVLADEMPGLSITVFGRHADFERALESDKPDAVLALRPVLEDRAMQVDLEGLREGRSAEPYVLMSLERPIDDPPSKTFGAVDLLGRKRMAELVGRLLGLSQAPRIKPVTKSADLLPLLQFKVADAILLPERSAREFQRSSNLRLNIAGIEGAAVGLACVAFLSEPGRRIARESVLRLSSKTKEQLGVEAWK